MNKKKLVDLLKLEVCEREWKDTCQRFEGTKFLDFKIYIYKKCVL
jgi:hypothetical protein